MKKAVLILSFILVSVVSFAQRQRTTAMFDADTTTRPKTGFYGIGIRSNNIYFVPTTGNNIRLANYSLFTGLTTNYYVKWNGSKFINTMMYGDGTNIGINTTSPGSLFDVRGQISASTGSLTNPAYSFVGDLNTGIYSSGADALALVTGGVNRIHVNSSGNVGIGTTSLTDRSLAVTKNITGGVTAYAILNNGVIQSDVTTSARYFQSSLNTQATSFTLPIAYHFLALQNSIGAGSTVTSQNGFYVDASLVGATNNYGFRGAIPSGTNRWNLYMDGTANNYLAGKTGVGTTSIDASALLHVSSTTQGTLLSRMTTAQINAIASPANGLMVYNTTLNKLCIYENGTWKQVTTTNM